jgi:outer membrane murein-binding lipoprotein Lpp
MPGLRSQLSWLLRGGSNTNATLASLTTDLQALQSKVAVIESAVHELQRGQAALGAKQLDEFDSVRTAVGAATDDLATRVAALHRQVEALHEQPRR